MWFILLNDYNMNVNAGTRFQVFHSGETMLYCGLLATSDTTLKTAMTVVGICWHILRMLVLAAFQ
jgi:hypothetical protein